VRTAPYRMPTGLRATCYVTGKRFGWSKHENSRRQQQVSSEGLRMLMRQRYPSPSRSAALMPAAARVRGVRNATSWPLTRLSGPKTLSAATILPASSNTGADISATLGFFSPRLCGHPCRLVRSSSCLSFCGYVMLLSVTASRRVRFRTRRSSIAGSVIREEQLAGRTERCC